MPAIRTSLLLSAHLVLGTLIAMSNPAIAATAAPAPRSLPTDAEGFHFLQGHWRIHHRQLKGAVGKGPWIEFDGEARFLTLLDGLVSVEELRDANGKPFGGAMRTFDRDKRTWSDSWVSAGFGVLNAPQHGRFVEGVGVFEAPDEFEGKPIVARGTWHRLGPDLVTWEQEFSFDGGKTWKPNWFMRFERITAAPFGLEVAGPK